MGTGPEEGAVWGIHTKWYRPGQNDKLRQPEPGPSENGQLGLFRSPQGIWELLRFGKFFLASAQLQATIPPRKWLGYPFTVPRSRSRDCPVRFQASNRRGSPAIPVVMPVTQERTG